MRRIGYLVVGIALTLTSVVSAQPGRFSPVERALLLGIGTGRVSNNNFLGALYALDAVQHSQWTRQQEIFRQRRLAYKSQLDQARINGVLQSEAARLAESAQFALRDDPTYRYPVSDVMLVWDTIGATFDEIAPEQMARITKDFDGGVSVRAVATGGPADKAGWQTGDIVVGLYKYRIRNYDNLAYVAERPEIISTGPVKTILYREVKRMDQTIDLSPSAAVSATSTAAEPMPTTPSPAPPAATTPAAPPTDEPTRVLPKEETPIPSEEPIEVQSTFEKLGVRGNGVNLTPPLFSFGRAVALTEIKPGSLAEKAGWKVGDRLASLGEYKTQSISDIDYVLRHAEAGDKLLFNILTGDQGRQGTVTLPVSEEARPAEK